jgi:hypothetical protein
MITSCDELAKDSCEKLWEPAMPVPEAMFIATDSMELLSLTI